MIKNISWLCAKLTKTKTAVFVLVGLFSLSGCSKVEYQQHCVPELSFQLWGNTPFVLLKQTDEPSSFMKENGYELDVAFQMSREDFPQNIPNVTHLKTGELQLLGPVIRYVKPLYNPFSSTTIYFYAKVNDRNVWVTFLELRKLASAYATPENQENFNQLMTGRFELFDRSSTLQCVVSAKS